MRALAHLGAAERAARDSAEVAARTWDPMWAALRGSAEQPSGPLHAPHALPLLGALVCLDHEGRERWRRALHGPDLLVGRYHAQHGPVELALGGLLDAEAYRLGAPHAHLTMDREGRWTLRSLSTHYATAHNGRLLEDGARSVTLCDGDELWLGVVRFRVELAAVSYGHWLEVREALLMACEEPSLYLMREGAVCGPRVALGEGGPLVVGRSWPGTMPPGEAGELAALGLGWDLGRLPAAERRHVAFRHALFGCEGGRCYVEPLAGRQATFVNRRVARERTWLEPGDEVGLNTVLLHVQLPDQLVMPRRKRLSQVAGPQWTNLRAPAGGASGDGGGRT